MPLPVDPFDVKECLYNGLSLIVIKNDTQISGYTASTDTVTKTAHGHAVGDALAYVSGTGWTGLTAGGIVYVIEAPTSSTFKVSATRGGTAITLGTSTVGIFRKAYIIGSRKLNEDMDQEESPLERPGSDNVNYEVRSVVTKRAQRWDFDLDEVKRLPLIFAGGMAGRITATVTLYIPDVDDADNICALVSEADFPATITREGGIAYGGEHSKATLRVKSNKRGVVNMTRNASVA